MPSSIKLQFSVRDSPNSIPPLGIVLFPPFTTEQIKTISYRKKVELDLYST